MDTIRGYDAYEVVSALQKCIRRGEESLALFWALEMEATAPAWLWARLRTIAYEDVGLAWPEGISLVHAAAEDYERFAKNKSSERLLCVVNAVLALSRAPKSRLADHALIAMQERIRRGWRPEVPDYARDKHTRAGVAMGRKWRHFVEVGALLENRAEVPDPYEAEAKQYLLERDEQGAEDPAADPACGGAAAPKPTNGQLLL